MAIARQSFHVTLLTPRAAAPTKPATVDKRTRALLDDQCRTSDVMYKAVVSTDNNNPADARMYIVRRLQLQ